MMFYFVIKKEFINKSLIASKLQKIKNNLEIKDTKTIYNCTNIRIYFLQYKKKKR